MQGYNVFITMIYYYVAHNSISQPRDTFSYITMMLVRYPQELTVLSLAVAFDILTQHGTAISDFYRAGLSAITDNSINTHALPVAARNYITRQFTNAWMQKYTTFENPIKRQYHLNGDKVNPKHNIDLVYEMFYKVHDREYNPYYDTMFCSET